jgi:hypothetical protein
VPGGGDLELRSRPNSSGERGQRRPAQQPGGEARLDSAPDEGSRRDWQDVDGIGGYSAEAAANLRVVGLAVSRRQVRRPIDCDVRELAAQLVSSTGTPQRGRDQPP